MCGKSSHQLSPRSPDSGQTVRCAEPGPSIVGECSVTDSLMLPMANGLLIVGLRPEAILLSLSPASGLHPVPVVVSEPLGTEVIVIVKLGAELVKIRTGPEVRPEPNQLVYIAAEPSGIRLFDADAGEAIDR